MKESIFFNKQQLQIIRWYNYLYTLFFEYGVWFFGFLISLLVVSGLIMFPIFSEVYGKETGDTTRIENQMRTSYMDQRSIINSFSGFHVQMLGGPVQSLTGGFSSQDNLINFSGLILPRTVLIDQAKWNTYAEPILNSTYDKNLINSYFLDIFVAPLQKTTLNSKPYAGLPVQGSIKQFFGLSCLDTISAGSFVCQHYVNQFLKSFYVYDLAGVGGNNAMNDTFTVNTQPIPDEFFTIYEKLKYNSNNQKRFCSGILQYLQYGGKNDSRFGEIFSDCGSEEYATYTELRDFLTIKESLALGYVDAKVSSSKLLNEYKLFVMQQLLYKALLASEDANSLFQSYLSFLSDLLLKESNRNGELINQFTRDFTYWYNVSIVDPYLKDEKSKIDKETRNTLTTRLFSIHNGNKTLNFTGLAKQTTLTIDTTSTLGTPEKSNSQNLEELFRANLPGQFRLTSLVNQEETESLVVKGLDRDTDVRLEAVIKFDGVKLYVEKVSISGNKALESFVNALLERDHYVFVKMLQLISDNLAIADQNSTLKLDLCAELKQKYPTGLLLCSDSKIQIEKGQTEQASGTIYTFLLQKGSLIGVEISDKILETKVLQNLDIGKITKDTLAPMIPVIVNYEPKDEISGFGMKEQLLVNDKFMKYFSKAPKKVEVSGGSVRIYFEVEGINFIGGYDVVTNRLAPISLDFGAARKPIIIQKMELNLDDQHRDELNAFLLNPINYIQKINPNLVKKYFVDGKLTLSQENK
ncbi:MAG: hypothetical protein HG424_001570 [candidate division SR1 bacterium]|nr:hypothetical protein [candidate division SR1 bacterium]